MGISSALNNAASGLGRLVAAGRHHRQQRGERDDAGYARRTTELSSLTAGGDGRGVKVAGTYRAENAFLTAERRGMDAPRGHRHALGRLRADHGGGRRARGR